MLLSRRRDLKRISEKMNPRRECCPDGECTRSRNPSTRNQNPRAPGNQAQRAGITAHGAHGTSAPGVGTPAPGTGIPTSGALPGAYRLRSWIQRRQIIANPVKVKIIQCKNNLLVLPLLSLKCYKLVPLEHCD